MRIPTLFHVRGGRMIDVPFNGVHQRILDGDPDWVPRRKWDGVAALYDTSDSWYLRREVRSPAGIPRGFKEVGHSKMRDDFGNPVRRWGWVPVEKSYFLNQLRVALLRNVPELVPGATYELCGPHIAPSGCPEGFTVPTLIRHADAEICTELEEREMTFDSLRKYFTETLAGKGWEGIVWHRASDPAQMVKLRVADFA